MKLFDHLLAAQSEGITAIALAEKAASDELLVGTC
jgi:hypothetical protein